MNARLKLNQIYSQAALVIAGIIALIAESWLLFFLLAATLCGLAVSSGDIRPNPSRGGSHSRRR